MEGKSFLIKIRDGSDHSHKYFHWRHVLDLLALKSNNVLSNDEGSNCGFNPETLPLDSTGRDRMLLLDSVTSQSSDERSFHIDVDYWLRTLDADATDKTTDVISLLSAGEALFEVPDTYQVATILTDTHLTSPIIYELQKEGYEDHNYQVKLLPSYPFESTPGKIDIDFGVDDFDLRSYIKGNIKEEFKKKQLRSHFFSEYNEYSYNDSKILVFNMMPPTGDERPPSLFCTRQFISQIGETIVDSHDDGIETALFNFYRDFSDYLIRLLRRQSFSNGKSNYAVLYFGKQRPGLDAYAFIACLDDDRVCASSACLNSLPLIIFLITGKPGLSSTIEVNIVLKNREGWNRMPRNFMRAWKLRKGEASLQQSSSQELLSIGVEFNLRIEKKILFGLR